MAGIYIHIPFCAKRCIYCDFFSNTEMKYKEAYVCSVLRELELRSDYIGNEPVETIYWGGGTPSQLLPEDFELIFEKIYQLYDVSVCKEITLEANPDDLTDKYISSLRNLPFNRISVGIQSFKDDDLYFLNRRHTELQARKAIKSCQENGFDNISIDLIYGLPSQSLADWEKNLDIALTLNVQHISAYHLIYEEGTKLHQLKERGKIIPIHEEVSVEMFSLLIDKLTKAGFIHYEISNFGRENYFSRHNTSYWKGKKYLGVGASAHSFNTVTRQWNIASIPAYIKGIDNGNPVVEKEVLDLNTRYNEFILTGLRTMWGVDLAVVKQSFGQELYSYCCKQVNRYRQEKLVELKDNKLKLTRKGIFISDGIISDLLYV